MKLKLIMMLEIVLQINLILKNKENSNLEKKYIDKINNIFTDYTVVSLRTLRYPYKACMGQHTDAPLPEEGNSNAGLIIQLTDPNMYKGGGLFMGKELIELEQGDSALYSYTTPHRVTQILKGVRIICNVRLLKNG